MPPASHAQERPRRRTGVDQQRQDGNRNGNCDRAVRAIHDWLDGTGFTSSCCVIEPGNAGSRRVAEKLGYQHTGETLLGGVTVYTYRRGA